AQSLAREPLIVAIELDDRDRDARILLAVPLSRAALEAHFADRLKWTETVEWSAREQAVLARRVLRLDALLLEEQPLGDASPEAVRNAMLSGIRELGLSALPWTDEARNLQARMELVRQLEGESGAGWPAVNDSALEASLEHWLAP